MLKLKSTHLRKKITMLNRLIGATMTDGSNAGGGVGRGAAAWGHSGHDTQRRRLRAATKQRPTHNKEDTCVDSMGPQAASQGP